MNWSLLELLSRQFQETSHRSSRWGNVPPVWTERLRTLGTAPTWETAPTCMRADVPAARRTKDEPGVRVGNAVMDGWRWHQKGSTHVF